MSEDRVLRKTVEPKVEQSESEETDMMKISMICAALQMPVVRIKPDGTG
jgi:hypothetical protein